MPVDGDLLLVLRASGLGSGAVDLGESILAAFLSQLYDSGTLPAQIICLNSGIFLTTQGSYARELLERFAAAGSGVLSCRTCLEYYGRSDKLVVGEPTTMKDTVQALLSFRKILQP